MLKIRITFNQDNPDEMETALEILREHFKVLNESKIYVGRGKSKYNNIYLDIENTEKGTDE